MALQHTLQTCLEDWKRISTLDFCLLDEEDEIYITTCDKPLPASSKIQEFRESDALTVANTSRCMYKIMNGYELQYILVVWGFGDSVPVIGELAVCQIQTLLTAYNEKNDKNTFMLNLLMGNYNEIDYFSKAKKLHISTSSKRAVFLIETKQSQDEHALATIRNIFSVRTKDFISAVNDNGIIIVRELTANDTYEDLEELAFMLIDMLNTEAMTSAWISYSKIAENIGQLTNAYKEARTALEVGKIFYAEKNVFGYSRLGIGRLIYQLPVSICEMFINEIFKDEPLESIDEETFHLIRTFFENNLNLSETSRQLYVHRNTLVYRFEKLQKKFGLDIRTFEDALTFKLAMMVADYINYSK